MKLLDSITISEFCDYSFGDQAGMINNIPGAYTKDANISNSEFIDKCNAFKSSGKKFMTLFIDNIRLYKRPIHEMDESCRPYVEDLMNQSDLLQLCSQLKDIKFLIFTGLEDTSIDHYIFDKIPDNVLGIYAANAITFGGKVHPIPYGIQRKMNSMDNRKEILLSMVDNNSMPEKLLYVNHSVYQNHERLCRERGEIYSLFSNKSWATTDSRIDYSSFLNKIKSHKFMICPDGNAKDCDCHRNWEVLYMCRVPVMKRCEYLEYIFKDLPVLFVNEYSDVTEELLNQNDDLFYKCLQLDFNKLDLDQQLSEILNLYKNI